MFAFFRTSRPKKSSRQPLRRFRLETLESRNCPSAVGFSMSAQTANAHNVAVQGQVIGSESGYQVTLSGPVSATISVDSSGGFSYLGSATGLGTITGTVTDSDGDSAQGSTDIMDTPPQISSLIVEATGKGKQVDVSGNVSAQSSGGLTVTFSGSAGVGGSATTDANGNFNLVTTAANLGEVDATVTDVWGMASPTSSATLTVMPPQITGFGAIDLGNGTWQFQGTVSGLDAADDSVQLSGMASSGATPNASGYFSVTVVLGTDNPSGIEYATATDVWGQTSNQASYMFFG